MKPLLLALIALPLLATATANYSDDETAIGSVVVIYEDVFFSGRKFNSEDIAANIANELPMKDCHELAKLIQQSGGFADCYQTGFIPLPTANR